MLDTLPEALVTSRDYADGATRGKAVILTLLRVDLFRALPRYLIDDSLEEPRRPFAVSWTALLADLHDHQIIFLPTTNRNSPLHSVGHPMFHGIGDHLVEHKRKNRDRT